jgi:hypothetical protein
MTILPFCWFVFVIASFLRINNDLRFSTKRAKYAHFEQSFVYVAVDNNGSLEHRIYHKEKVCSDNKTLINDVH